MSRRHHFYLFFYLFLTSNSPAAFGKTTTIPAVVVKPPRYRSAIFSDGDKTILTHNQMHMTGITTVSQALRALGGVQLQDLSGNGSQVLTSLRGFGANASSNTLILINGIPITNPDMAPPDLNAVPLYAIEYIEIMAGSESVLYGDQAVGGTINLVTRQTAKEKMALSCTAGSYNQALCAAFITNNSQKKLHYTINLSKQHTDNYRDHNDYDQNTLLGNVDYRYPRGQWHLNFKLANEDMQYPGALTAAQVRENRRQASNQTDFFRNWNELIHLHHQHNISKALRLETDLMQRKMDGQGVLSSPFTQSRTTYFIQSQLKTNVHHGLLISGIALQKDDYNLTSSFGDTDNNQQKFDVFALFKQPINTALTFTIGARGAQQISHLRSFTNSDTINRALATTLEASYQASKQAQLYIKRASNFRFPKADENASSATGVVRLRTQRGVSYEIGSRWTSTQLTGKIALYQLDLRDEIAFDPTQTPRQPFGANNNLSPTQRRGFALSASKKLLNRLTAGAQYHYVNARFQNGVNTNKRIPLVAEHLIQANATYQLTEHWSIYGESLFTSSQYAANDNANIAGKLGGYTLYNMNLHYKNKRLDATFRINNITNKAYYFYTAYQNISNSEAFYPAPERNLNFTLTYTFA